MNKCYTYLIIIGASLLLVGGHAKASHIRAGEIFMERLCNEPGLTYKITVIIYRDNINGVPAQQGQLDPHVEDDEGSVTVSSTSLGFIDGGETEVLEYTYTYTYGGSGRFKISYTEDYRNAEVLNITGQPSEFVPFYIESEFFVNPNLGCNAPPKLLIPPLDRACVGQRFIHNPGAFDEEGDSLSYELVDVKSTGNTAVPGFVSVADPEFTQEDENGNPPGSFSLDAKTGDLVWDSPTKPGQFNVAFVVIEWRNGDEISRTNRDMQIIVTDCDNERPNLVMPQDTCVVAGSSMDLRINAEDPDRNSLTLSSAFLNVSGQPTGSVFSLESPRNQARFPSVTGRSPVSSVFSWQTVCEDVRLRPYTVTFKAKDNLAEDQFELADLKTLSIQVIGPAPNLTDAAYDEARLQDGVKLVWDPYQCQNAKEMTIWRRSGSYDFTPSYCETGLPANAGYVKIGVVNIDQAEYTDFDVIRGVNYCYRIYAEFPNPTLGEGIASAEVCAFFPQVAPYLLNVDVESTDPNQGVIDLRWSTPIDVDEVLFPRPWTYRLIRSTGFAPGADQLLLPDTFDENDTTFTDTDLDTENTIYNYQVVFYANGDSIEASRAASSVRLSTAGGSSSILLNWEANTPWSNNTSKYPLHYIYRDDKGDRNFRLIDSVDVSLRGLTYLDDGSFDGVMLEEEDEYCYFVTTSGTYDFDSLPDPLLNRSQYSCAIVTDTTPPCPPILALDTITCEEIGITQDPSADCGEQLDCANLLLPNVLTWVDGAGTGCDNSDIVSYSIYELTISRENAALLTDNLLDRTFTHSDLNTLERCYYVTAIDDDGNESAPSNIVCGVDCPYYLLPNVFTPNSDGENDLFIPCKCPRFVEQVDFKVYNRHGVEVFSRSNDIFINWDGKTNGGNELSPGVYYYQADVTYYSGVKETLKGWISLLGNGNDSN